MSGTEGRERCKLTSVATLFLLGDVVASAEYYRDNLGFTFERCWGEPPCFVILTRDGVRIMLQTSQEHDGVAPNSTASDDDTWDAYIWMTGLDAFYDDIKAKGVKVLGEDFDTFYNNQEIVVEDCNGYLICFGQHIEAATADA